jgi:hypothetical protein
VHNAKNLSRKAAKPQRKAKARLLSLFFLSLRLCAFAGKSNFEIQTTLICTSLQIND